MSQQLEPKVSRPLFPEGYGIPETDDDLLPWDYVANRMAGSRNYWIATASPEGRVSATPVWGVWVEDTLFFDGSPQTRRGRNIAANPSVAVHLEDGTQAVMIEGEAYEVIGPEPELANQLAAAYAAKYADEGYTPEPNQWENGGLFRLVKRRVFAWTQFPKDVTRWVFQE